MSLPIDILPKIKTALKNGDPVVALESTIISHGMPHPQNIETACTVEDAVSAEGAIPATIAVIDGRLKVGLDEADLNRLATAGPGEVTKLTRANLAHCMAGGGTGSTTVAATMIGAHLAGIDVFATGGIGGVHRGAETSFDVSADLYELARTPVAVICAGAKAILDIPKTLEVLETQGVPVIAYGQTAFPAFWSRNSGLTAPMSASDPKDIARAIAMQRELKMPAGCLIANPIPEEDEIAPSVINPIIEQALADATRQKITHGAVTPFVLQRVLELTNGASLKANIALVLNNARLAAKIATALGKPHEMH
ncbi:MAG: pseudouridine-5'-phosphate glycosidase [Paracoccaceae bacterium]|nr:pseudouridine-5'-phosphate glycosidase [Paracoccaceae bacterium]